MEKEDLSVGITGFIDILGFGEKVKNSKTIEDIENIRSSVKKIQNQRDL